MRILVISTSLKPLSRSRIMARACFHRLQVQDATAAHPIDTEWLDLRDVGTIPTCDADSCWSHPHTALLRDAVEQADGIILATPIYNFSVSAAAKNLVELTGRQWESKVVGFINAAGAAGSYMAIMGLANALMLDFRCVIVPRFVYATGQSFDNQHIADEDLLDRIDDLARMVIRLTAAFSDRD